MPANSAVVLVVDRLGAAWLGPYGNTWLETPNFNTLAAQSVLCETAIADSPHLDTVCRSFWTGRHAMSPAEEPVPTLAHLAETAGAKSTLLTDDPRVAEHPQASGFGERRILPSRDVRESATEVEQTGLYAFFDAARAALRQQQPSTLLWLHSQGMSGPWDAPLELRYQFADDDDPQPPDFVVPPQVLLKENADPDELLGYVHAYAGQVALLDMCLGMLLDALDEHPQASETALIVTSARGFPLGEHRRVGPCDEALFGELLHVPLLLRTNEQAMLRSQRIVQPHELFSIAAEACLWQPADKSALRLELQMEAPRAACAVGNQQRAIRTPAWFLRESQTDDGMHRELYAKPDDRWEANEVSSRCGGAVELLAAELDRFDQAARQGNLAESPPLANVLCDIWR